MRDPYAVLGLTRKAGADDIKAAYRTLARRLHPDVNRSDPRAEERFKEVSAAYDLLSDPKKRARFDRGEIDADGTERGFRSGAGAGASGFGFRSSRRSGRGESYGFDSGFFDDDTAFSDMFRRAGGRDKTAGAGSGQRSGSGGGSGKAGGAEGAGFRPRRGQDAHYRLKTSFEEAALGCTKRITLTNRKTLDVRIPPGTEEGRVLRLKGQGADGFHGGEPGDALVEIGVRPTPVFKREGDSVVVEVPVTLKEAVLGGRITVPTLEGRAVVTVPEHANTGTMLRLRGKGIPAEAGARGDLLVRLSITLPDPADPKLKALVKKLKDPEDDVREKAGLI